MILKELEVAAVPCSVGNHRIQKAWIENAPMCGQVACMGVGGKTMKNTPANRAEGNANAQFLDADGYEIDPHIFEDVTEFSIEALIEKELADD